MARIAVRFLCGVALALLVALPEQAAPQECPGITSAELSGAAVTCANSNCPTGPGSFITDIIAQLCDVNTFGALPATCTTCECCKKPITNLAAGTVLELIGPDPKNDCDLGGRGGALGEGAVWPSRGPSTEARHPPGKRFLDRDRPGRCRAARGLPELRPAGAADAGVSCDKHLRSRARLHRQPDAGGHGNPGSKARRDSRLRGLRLQI